MIAAPKALSARLGNDLGVRNKFLVKNAATLVPSTL
jgi:hypothetical protein